jgi:hypothetical protein
LIDLRGSIDLNIFHSKDGGFFGLLQTLMNSFETKKPYYRLYFKPRPIVMNRLKFILANLSWVVALSLLISGSDLLNLDLFLGLVSSGTLPLGTLITWMGFVGLAYVLTMSLEIMRSPKTLWEKVVSFFGKVGYYAAWLWPVLGWILAGNLSFEFTSAAQGFRGSPAASVWFWDLNYGIPILCLMAFIVGGLTLIVRRIS